MRSTTICLAVCLLALLGVSAGAGENPKSEKRIEIDNFSFVPQTVTVEAGTTVRWVNRDDVPHTVVGTAKEFSSRVLDTGDEYTHTFTTPGSFEYYCSVHPHMKGKVIVEQANQGRN